MRRIVFVLALLTAWPAQAQEAPPTRAQLLQDAPNPFWNAFAIGPGKTEEIYPGLYTFSFFATRSIFLVTDEGVIATDPISVRAAEAYRAAIAEVTDQPVKYVVYSHNHYDHVLGGQIFKDEGATFISHIKCAEAFYDIPHPDVVMPDITFTGDYRLELGGRSLDLLYFGRNHSDCLVVMRPDDSPYLHIVDLVTPGGMPFTYMADYFPHHMVRTLKALEALEWDYFIPGHMVPIAPKSALTERRQYFEALMAAVKAELDAADGNPFADIKPAVRERLEDFSYLRGFDRNIDQNIDRILSYYAIGW